MTADFDAAIGLGSNLGDKAANIARAIAVLTAGGDIGLVKRSRDYVSPPWGVLDQDAFVNACITVATQLSPHELLLRCQKVENDIGRVRHKKWGPRLIDVDILTYRNETIQTADLTVPHPLIGQRAFVLLPLAEVAPDLMFGAVSLQELISKVDAAGVYPQPATVKP